MRTPVEAARPAARRARGRSRRMRRRAMQKNVVRTCRVLLELKAKGTTLGAKYFRSPRRARARTGRCDNLRRSARGFSMQASLSVRQEAKSMIKKLHHN